MAVADVVKLNNLRRPFQVWWQVRLSLATGRLLQTLSLGQIRIGAAPRSNTRLDTRNPVNIDNNSWTMLFF